MWLEILNFEFPHRSFTVLILTFKFHFCLREMFFKWDIISSFIRHFPHISWGIPGNPIKSSKKGSSGSVSKRILTSYKILCSTFTYDVLFDNIAICHLLWNFFLASGKKYQFKKMHYI